MATAQIRNAREEPLFLPHVVRGVVDSYNDSFGDAKNVSY